jgi:D-mannonate dehydratase
MHIIFCHIRQFKIDDVRQFVDVDAARGDIGCYQYLQLALFELGQRFGACALTFVTVDSHGRDAGFIQLLS